MKKTLLLSFLFCWIAASAMGQWEYSIDQNIRFLLKGKEFRVEGNTGVKWKEIQRNKKMSGFLKGPKGIRIKEGYFSGDGRTIIICAEDKKYNRNLMKSWIYVYKLSKGKYKQFGQPITFRSDLYRKVDETYCASLFSSDEKSIALVGAYVSSNEKDAFGVRKEKVGLIRVYSLRNKKKPQLGQDLYGNHSHHYLTGRLSERLSLMVSLEGSDLNLMLYGFGGHKLQNGKWVKTAPEGNEANITAQIAKEKEKQVPPKKIEKETVDTDIPTTKTIQQHTYALIIGNEDYQSKQKGLSVEQNVPFAENDAKVFKEYCTKTLGVPEKNIRLLLNAGSIEMKQAIEWANYMAKINNGKAKLIFYYSGHGLPDDNKQSHLIPVDVSGLSLNYAVKLNDVCNQLTEHPTQQVSVFLDACFSGGARNQGLVAMKSIRVKPKEESFAGNMVVFASSSGDETSAVYDEKQHGFFTYFLLKKLQQTKGETDLKALSDYIYNSVRLEAGHIGKIQTPQVNPSSQAADKWEEWKLK